MSAMPLNGSSSSPREPGFSDNAIAFTVKSRRRRSSLMVAGGTIAFPGLFFDPLRGVVGGRSDDRLSRLVIRLAPGHVQFRPHVTWHQQMQAAQFLVDALYGKAGLLQFFLELKRITLHAEIDVPDGETSDEVADGAAGEVQIQTRVSGNLLNQVHTTLLVRCEPGLHAIDIVWHLNV